MRFNTEIEQQEYLQTRIDEVIDWFDFNKVYSVMTTLKWGWGTDNIVPEIQDLRKHVRSAMKYTFDEVIRGKEISAYVTGGFNIQCIKDDVIYFKVTFELAEWTTD